MIQEAIRMVLESIYEPIFQKKNCSFGFRASNGVHEAMVTIADNSTGLTKAIEGDVENAYPSLDREILIKILSQRIKDKKFLKFIKSRLNLKVYDTKTQKHEITNVGIPQGGIDSPYLWNIYLLEMDTFILKYLEENFPRSTTKRNRSPINPKYSLQQRNIVKLNKNFYTKTNQRRIFCNQKRANKITHLDKSHTQ